MALDPGELAARAALRELDGLDNRALSALIERFGSAAAAWRVGPGGWGLPGRAAGRREWERTWSRIEPAAVLAGLERRGIRAVMPGCAGYPRELAAAGGPPLLYAGGDPAAVERPAVAVVGTRRATPYGLAVARRLASGLAEAGLAVVSGLALGIDGAAHEGALAAGGITVAVLGGGLEEVYPREHAGLARRVAGRGLLLTEHGPEERPRRHHFPARNRLMAAIALAVVVVEAPPRSGALLTAGFAAGMGRAVMAVPGRADSWASAGCLELLREGKASLVRGAGDVLEDLDRQHPHWRTLLPAPGGTAGRAPAAAAVLGDLTAEERHIYDLLASEGAAVAETAAARLGWPVPRVWVALTGLELKGLVVRVGATYVPAAAERPGSAAGT